MKTKLTIALAFAACIAAAETNLFNEFLPLYRNGFARGALWQSDRIRNATNDFDESFNAATSNGLFTALKAAVVDKALQKPGNHKAPESTSIVLTNGGSNTNTLRDTFAAAKSDEKAAHINTLGTSGKFCEVRGHAWCAQQKFIPPGTVATETRCLNCQIQTQTVEWK